jgi:pimeloyl-ACP methyl ester carboxylesterase
MHELATTDLTPELRRIGAPLTVVYATRDPAAPRVYANAYAAVRGARFVRVDNSGHMIMVDQPQRFHTAVREFLR